MLLRPRTGVVRNRFVFSLCPGLVRTESRRTNLHAAMPYQRKPNPLRSILLEVLLPLWLLTTAARGLDLSRATVFAPPNLSRSEEKAVVMLIEEVEKRSQIRWPRAETWPSKAPSIIAVGLASRGKDFAGPRAAVFAADGASTKPEGFRILTRTNSGAPTVFVLGNDARGVLFGVGHLLRSLRMSAHEISLVDGFDVTTAPRYPLRGHQLGYRPKTHSYDAWDVPTWEQYIRDLVVFGCNAVELIPPRSDDADTSPHFPLPPLEMLQRLSRLLDDYGLDVWIWYPAMDRDYSDPKTVEFALREWAAVFKAMPRLDAVFVPGGDPGHTQPKHLMKLLEQQTTNLHRFHPRAQMWVSPQGFNEAWLDEFVALLKEEQPSWLNGIVFGPQVRVSLPQLRALVPARYPIRNYPDITHSRQCQFPVPDWDTAFAVTSGREGINPRPLGYASIARLLQPHTIGFITYSEGCNDDVNKAVWSALGWNPDADVTSILRDYSRYFIGERYADTFAQGLLALERNWRGLLLPNESVYTTLLQFQSMERNATPHDRLNWRFQAALYRAYYDAYVRRRLLYETGLENHAMDLLREARRRGALVSLREAEVVLERAVTQRVATDWRERVFELAEALFQSIRLQSSVERYQAIGVDRGATLDTLDYPLNNRPWLRERFAALRRLPNEAARLDGIEEILQWADPGPGGFYDDLGNVSSQPHLVPGLPFAQDPAFLESPHAGFEEGEAADESDEKPGHALRYSWLNHAESMNDAPLTVAYAGLDPTAHYKLRVVYGGDSPKRKIRLVVNDNIEIHPLMTKPWPVRPVEFELPSAATARGTLRVHWTREPGLGGNGRGCQVSEVWLLRAP